MGSTFLGNPLIKVPFQFAVMKEKQVPSFQHLLHTLCVTDHISQCSSSADLQCQGHVKVQSVLCKAALMADLRSVLPSKSEGPIWFSSQGIQGSVWHPTSAACCPLRFVLTYLLT